MASLRKWIVLMMAVCLITGLSWSQEKKEVHKTFSAKKTVRIDTVSGSCIVKKGAQKNIQVDLEYSVKPEKAFEYEMRESGRILKLKERWHGSSSGEVTWTLTVPADTEIEFSTASGDLFADGLTNSIEADTASGEVEILNSEGEFDISTASGDVTLESTSGEFDISTASGDIDAAGIKGFIELSTASGEIEVDDASGTFELSCASGDIDAKRIVLEEESEFSTASGKVYVNPAVSPEFDLMISCASGQAMLDYKGQPIKGTFEFTARKNRGRIYSAVKFDKEEEFMRDEYTYVKKSFSKGDTPKIYLETATGRVTLKD